MKKLCFFALAFALLLSLFSSSAFASEEKLHLFMDIPFGITESEFRKLWANEFSNKNTILSETGEEKKNTIVIEGSIMYMGVEYDGGLVYTSSFEKINGENLYVGIELYKSAPLDETENIASLCTAYIKNYNQYIELYEEPSSSRVFLNDDKHSGFFYPPNHNGEINQYHLENLLTKFDGKAKFINAWGNIIFVAESERGKNKKNEISMRISISKFQDGFSSYYSGKEK